MSSMGMVLVRASVRSGAVVAFFAMSCAGTPIRHRFVAPGATPTTTTIATAAAAEPGAPVVPEAGGKAIRLCVQGTPEHAAALTAMDSVDATIKALAPAADPGPAVKTLRRILGGPCFLIAEGDWPALDPDSGLALKTFWEAGGRDWVRQFLAPPEPPVFWIAPDVPKTLTVETHPDSPLRWMLCPSGDTTCGLETRGWVLRARWAFEEYEQAHRYAGGDLPSSVEDCEKQYGAVGGTFAAWRACVESVSPRVDAFPVGSFQAPTEGWLLMAGWRGHYKPCDEVRAYDLATGSAYVSKSCTTLALRHDGTVDRSATDAARHPASETGVLPIEALREATWMMLLTTAVQPRIRQGWGCQLPTGMHVEATQEELEAASQFGGVSMSSSSGQSTIEWSFMRRGRSVATGQLTWPESGTGAAGDHAVKLLAIAEASMRPGCPPVSPPATLDFGRLRTRAEAQSASEPNTKARLDQQSAMEASLRRVKCPK